MVVCLSLHLRKKWSEKEKGRERSRERRRERRRERDRGRGGDKDVIYTELKEDKI